MTSPEEKKRSPRRDWRALVDLQANSGLSVRAFCESHGLSTTYFYARRRELRPSAAPIQSFESSEFVALPISASPTALDVELSLGDGVVLRVRRG